MCAPAPEWGSLDILEACGASDLGSNPSSGVRLGTSRFHIIPISPSFSGRYVSVT